MRAERKVIDEIVDGLSFTAGASGRQIWSGFASPLRPARWLAENNFGREGAAVPKKSSGPSQRSVRGPRDFFR
jgi:hypothetical protein